MSSIVPPHDRVTPRLDGAYQFDYDVEIPKRPGRPRKGQEAPAIPFAQIPVGASYFARGAGQSTVSAAAVAFRKRFEHVLFVTHWFARDPKTGLAGVRIWRVR
jgi:hypothetical protein